ncbi:hypothetical protein B0T10DRAFT_186123 [Thelonectria olida]|uniref:Protein prenyltransferase n=1 Tax=Thelonectria olida TaxID=1576542 RepID=A0A9P9AVR5_9HYPO|nr:hypothetical protein B0T10DRAFT_186123 [Thelonectria olida]
MSRALDKGVKEALRNGDHQSVFDDISNALVRPQDQLIEIEILRHSALFDPDVNFLQDDNALAVPKMRLVQAFIVARQILMSHVKGKVNDSYAVLTKTTAVILLMDPEFLTAANTRKRLLQERLRHNDATSSLKDEKHFIDSLLTSRLHRHTKSPTLWNHRRWLMDQFRTQGLDIAVEDDIRNIIAVAGERHPRNYYAWCHARYLVNTILDSSQNCEKTLSGVINIVKKWSFSHHDDISGWQFLLLLLVKHPSETSGTIRETLHLVEPFKWRNESVWYFLRYAVASPHATHQDRDEVSRIRTMLWETATEESQERHTLEAAERWIYL